MNTSTNATLLSVRNIAKSFGGKTIIENIQLELKEGELVCLLGQSGAGKSTLFHVIAGLYEPDRGEILLRGENITGKPGKISYMLQKDLLFPHLTILDNAALGLFSRGVKKSVARETASAEFEKFGLEGCQKLYPSQLSGGMCQRAALLRTYLSSQGIALLDEPFSALDTLTKSAMHRWYLQVMREISLSTLFITHDIDEAILLSDRVYIMGNKPGTITAEIRIDVPKPRAEDFNLTEDFLRYKRQLVEMLK